MSEQVNDVETGSPSTEEASTEEAPKKTVGEIIALGASTVGIGASVAAMAVVGSPLIIAAGVCSSGMGGYVLFQQSQIANIAKLLATKEALEKEINSLGEQNDKLENTVKELGSTVDGLNDIEAALQVLTATQGQSVEDFRAQIEDNKKILEKMESNLKGNVLQNMLSVIVRSDKDGDFTIDKDELEELIVRMKNMNGVTLYEDRFRDAIEKSGGSLKAVMSVVRNLLMDENEEKDPIFTLDS